MNIMSKFSKKVIILTLLFSFVVPMSIFYEKDFFQLNKAIYNISLVFIYTYYLSKGTFKFNLSDILIIYFIVIRFLITKDLESFGLVYLLLIRHLDFKGINVTKKQIILILISILIYSIIHSQTIGLSWISTSIGERNEVGFYLIILYFVLRTNKFNKLALIILILGFFTYSRNYFLGAALIVYFEYIKNSKQTQFLKNLGFKRLSVISVIIVLVLFVYFRQAELVSFTSSTGLDRILQLKDSSNYHRFVANVYPIQYYIRNPKDLLLGVDYIKYSDFIYKSNLFRLYNVSKINAPHNYFFKTLYKYGAFSLIIFYIVGKQVNKYLTNYNRHILFIFFIYAMFLGTGFYENGLIFLIYIMVKVNENMEIKSNIN